MKHDEKQREWMRAKYCATILTSFYDEATFPKPTYRPLDFAPMFDARTVRASDSDKQSLLSAGKLKLAGKVHTPLLAPTTREACHAFHLWTSGIPKALVTRERFHSVTAEPMCWPLANV
jgi:hypothetical protein